MRVASYSCVAVQTRRPPRELEAARGGSIVVDRNVKRLCRIRAHHFGRVQDLLLRGTTAAWWEVGALAAIAGVLFLATWFLLRRSMMRE